ncbi:ATPase AAA+ type core [Lasiodiplodia theobromae]|uniref:Origin recognition complex subunit 4 n=1 Tax=Lasiodiplodia theobromae TaxID=45133 RepID=A0A5N5DR12_9PEZI|nr:Origin recognition complex subunit 4 [Lasiodiplodia theobromae]KAB2580418.1 Origin recognition complex subunit 4 [Lasiodiplodia theobromae]KAF4541058.1 Origin recognition complex subunit 4 [Lasiodiplodia theobromae]KAF9632406.1 ATPase AAA+ type core [Lasiodiplodia theobromae]
MATGARSAKRRKLSPPDDDALAAADKSTPGPTPAKSTLKRPTRRAGLLSTDGSRASSRLTRRQGHANDLDDPDVYDDFDSAFGESPARQLQSETITATKRAQLPKRATRAKPKVATQSDSQKENIPEDDSEQDNEEKVVPKPVRRGRNARVEETEAAPEAEKDDTDELVSAPARSRSGRAKAGAKKQETPAKKARTTRKAQENGHEEQDDEPRTARKPAGKTKTPTKPRASAIEPAEEKANLLDLVETGDKASENDAGDATPEPTVSPVSKRRNHSVKSQSTPKKAVEPSGTEPSRSALTSVKVKVLAQITGKEPVPLVGLEEEYKKVHQLVEQTISAGEGNSMLMIGARGSGKTALVNQVLRELSKDQRQDFHVIRLNGFFHTDDKLALREIWRQLGKEMDVEEDTIGKNYADTLATLLALLSHPSELVGEESNEVAKAVIFIMDEFDLFASHPRQTLLYNLFDIAQSKKAPITVLGLTTRIGVSENLEKRVKSRFSHRYVHLSLAKNLASFQEMCKSNLMLRPEAFSEWEPTTFTGQTPSKSRTSSKSKQAANPTNLITAWNASIDSLFADPQFIQTYLAPHYHLHKSVPAALSTFQVPIALLSPDTFPLTPAHFVPPTSTTAAAATSATLLAPPDSKLSLLPHLSDLGLALLVAAARLDIIHDADTCNFNMAYAEYVALASRAKIASAAGGALASGTKVWGREPARREWENLIRWELIMPVVGGGGSGGGIGGGTADSAMVRCDVALEEIAPSVGPGLDRVVERWCRQI